MICYTQLDRFTDADTPQVVYRPISRMQRIHTTAYGHHWFSISPDLYNSLLSTLLLWYFIFLSASSFVPIFSPFFSVSSLSPFQHPPSFSSYCLVSSLLRFTGSLSVLTFTIHCLPLCHRGSSSVTSYMHDVILSLFLVPSSQSISTCFLIRDCNFLSPHVCFHSTVHF